MFLFFFGMRTDLAIPVFSSVLLCHLAFFCHCAVSLSCSAHDVACFWCSCYHVCPQSCCLLCSMSCSQKRASTKIAQSWYSNYLFWSLSKHACVHNLNMFVSLLKPPRCIAICSFRIHPGVLQNAPTNIYAKITRGF